MRGLKKRITGGMLALVMSSALVLNVNAVTLDEAQQKADELKRRRILLPSSSAASLPA